MTATISGDGTSTLINLTTSGNTVLGDASTDTLNVGNGGLVKDASGNVGIGTSNPLFKLVVSKGGAEGIEFVPGGVSNVSTTQYYNRSGAAYTANAQDASYHSWLISGAEKARIDSSGNLLVGTTTIGGTGTYRGLTIGGGATQNLGVTYDYAGAVYRYNSTNENGWVWWNERSVGGPVQEFFVTTSFTKVGNINCTTTATNYVTSSDYRLKENIQPMTGALAKVAQLKPCTYTWKVDGSEGQGFIAHELGEVVPQCVSGEKDAVNEDGSIDPQGIDTSFLVATLTAAIQEQQAIITALQADVAALKAKP